jgi:RNA polymerase sigma-70 factor (ECF subfamily)
MSKRSTKATQKPGTGTVGVDSPSERLVCAFNDLRDKLVSTMLYVLGNREDAQDAAQEAFLKCWKALDTLGEIKDLRAWIFRIAINTARDMKRRSWYRRTKNYSGEETMLKGSSPPGALEEKEALQRLRKAIHNLRQDEKEVFLLRQNGDLTYDQIAEIRRSPVGTIKTQMRSALQKLRQELA